jgi:hypothetical protein
VGKFLEALYDDLSLYVRQSAWLNTAPERAKNDKSEGPRLSRLESMRKTRNDENYQPDMPTVDAEYLIGYLWEVGPTMAAGGYPGPVTHEEILAWQKLTGVELQPWEMRFLRRLSGEYLLESHRAEKADCPEPARHSATRVDLESVARGMQRALKEMANL